MKKKSEVKAEAMSNGGGCSRDRNTKRVRNEEYVPPYEQCNRRGSPSWRCREPVLPGRVHCEKHYNLRRARARASMEQHNAKRRRMAEARAMRNGGDSSTGLNKRNRVASDVDEVGEIRVPFGGFDEEESNERNRSGGGGGDRRKESMVESVEPNTPPLPSPPPGVQMSISSYVERKVSGRRRLKKTSEQVVSGKEVNGSDGEFPVDSGEFMVETAVPSGGFEAAESSERNVSGGRRGRQKSRPRKLVIDDDEEELNMESGVEMSIFGERKASDRRGRKETVEQDKSNEELVVSAEFPVESIENQMPTSGRGGKKVVGEEEQEIRQQEVKQSNKIKVNASQRRRLLSKVTDATRKTTLEGMEHNKSGQGTPRDTASSINLSVGDPRHEGASCKEVRDNIVPTKGKHSADQHLPVPVLLEKSDFHPVGENSGEYPSTESLVIQKTSNVVKCSYSLGQETISDELNGTRYRQTERAFHSVLVDVTRSSYPLCPRQGDEGDVSQNMPFVKSSILLPFWESFDSKITFNSIPQRPHFRKIEQQKEELREGLALGYMASFANIVEKTRTITFDEPQNSLEDKLVALDELEELGFMVHPIRCRLQELLKIKENCTQLENDSKEHERRFIEEKCNYGRIQEKIADLQKTINEVNEKLQSIKMEENKKELYVYELEKTTYESRQRIEAVRIDFDRVAAADLR